MEKGSCRCPTSIFRFSNKKLIVCNCNWTRNIYCTKIHSFLKQCFSVYENKVLLLMSVGARLERFGEKDLVFIKWRSCKNVLKTNGLYVNQSLDPNMYFNHLTQIYMYYLSFFFLINNCHLLYWKNPILSLILVLYKYTKSQLILRWYLQALDYKKSIEIFRNFRKE